MKLKFLTLLFLCSSLFAINPTPSVTPAMMRMAPDPDYQYTFDHLQSIPEFRKYKVGQVMRESHNSLICVYDFGVQGGAIGNIGLLSTDLKTPCTLPGKAVVRNGFIDITTALAGAVGTTVALSTGNTAADFKASATSATFAAVGQYIASPVYASVGTYVKLTTPNSVVNGVNLNPYQPYVTIGVGALTAGHFRAIFDYSLSE